LDNERQRKGNFTKATLPICGFVVILKTKNGIITSME